MEKELLKISRKGKHLVIIIDELQALEDIYINGQRDLLKSRNWRNWGQTLNCELYSNAAIG